jgi:hypothetical protein
LHLDAATVYAGPRGIKEVRKCAVSIFGSLKSYLALLENVCRDFSQRAARYALARNVRKRIFDHQ